MIKIKDLKEKMHETQPYLVTEVKNGSTDKGAPYLSMTLQDNTGTIDAKFWNVTESIQKMIREGIVYQFSFDVILYQKKLQLRVYKVEEITTGEVEMDQYVIASEISEVERKNQFERLFAMIENPIYRQLVRGMIAKRQEQYFTYPAASKIHHNYLGGLSEHSISMAEMALAVCEHYPQLDRDLLLSGALVHDIGKTQEMSGAITTEYTLEGKLEGHISIANGWLTEVAASQNLEGEEETILLHHLILSHHGKHEFGSPVLPQVQEAEVLSLIDNLDARLNTLSQALSNVAPGNWTSRMFALENRQFYKPKKRK